MALSKSNEPQIKATGFLEGRSTLDRKVYRNGREQGGLDPLLSIGTGHGEPMVPLGISAKNLVLETQKNVHFLHTGLVILEACH